MDKVTTVGIDLAKSVFSLHGVDAAGQVGSAAHACARSKLVELVAAVAAAA